MKRALDGFRAGVGGALDKFIGGQPNRGASSLLVSQCAM